MKTFEEKWTAWLDGQLSGRELTEFEASLPDKAAAEAEKAAAKKLGALLKARKNCTRNCWAISGVWRPPDRRSHMVDDSPAAVDWDRVARCLFGFCDFRHARQESR